MKMRVKHYEYQRTHCKYVASAKHKKIYYNRKNTSILTNQKKIEKKIIKYT